jgi:protein SCO1
MRKLVCALVLTALCAGCGAVKKKEVVLSPPAQPNDGAVITPAAAPSFLLRDQSGKLVGPQQDRGHWTIVTFLYTHCPDVCPLVTNQLAAAQRVDTDLRVIAVSVDPKRDTPAAVHHFLAEHHTGPLFRYVIGSEPKLAHVWALYHVASQPGPNGTVTHSTYEILIDPKGRERVFFDAKVTAHDVTSMLHQLDKGAPA